MSRNGVDRVRPPLTSMIRPACSTTITRLRSCGGAVTYSGPENRPTRTSFTPRAAVVAGLVAVAAGVPLREPVAAVPGAGVVVGAAGDERDGGEAGEEEANAHAERIAARPPGRADRSAPAGARRQQMSRHVRAHRA